MDIFIRSKQNPIITPDMISVDERFEVIGAFNPAATPYKNGAKLVVRVALRPKNQAEDEVWSPVYDMHAADYKILRFKRSDVDTSDPRFFISKGVMYLTSISVFYQVDLDEKMHVIGPARPFMMPQDATETHGIEDPRITLINDIYYILYTAVSPHGQAVSLAKTLDFQTVERLGVILPPNNKDCVLFPKRFNNQYHLIHRPSAEGVPHPEMWFAASPDLLTWGQHLLLISPRDGWESGRIGAGIPPIETPDGWLLFYHGADETHYYKMGYLLLDLNEPWKILRRSTTAIFEPEENYEMRGFFGGVVFGTGAIVKDDNLYFFYGASDTTCCVARCSLGEILDYIRVT